MTAFNKDISLSIFTYSQITTLTFTFVEPRSQTDKHIMSMFNKRIPALDSYKSPGEIDFLVDICSSSIDNTKL